MRVLRGKPGKSGRQELRRVHIPMRADKVCVCVDKGKDKENLANGMNGKELDDRSKIDYR